MANGGARPGAGRPKGGANKLNDEARRKALDGGITPLEYLLSVMRDIQNDQKDRVDAAKAAAPYVHARLSNIDMNANVEGKVVYERANTGVNRE